MLANRFSLVNQVYLVDQLVKNLPAVQKTRFNPRVGKMPWGRKWQPTPVFLLVKSHRQRRVCWAIVTRVGHNLVTKPSPRELSQIEKYSEVFFFKAVKAASLFMRKCATGSQQCYTTSVERSDSIHPSTLPL